MNNTPSSVISGRPILLSPNRISATMRAKLVFAVPGGPPHQALLTFQGWSPGRFNAKRHTLAAARPPTRSPSIASNALTCVDTGCVEVKTSTTLD